MMMGVCTLGKFHSLFLCSWTGKVTKSIKRLCLALTMLIAYSRHSDNLNNLVIASVSLGAERTFIMSSPDFIKGSTTSYSLP